MLRFSLCRPALTELWAGNPEKDTPQRTKKKHWCDFGLQNFVRPADAKLSIKFACPYSSGSGAEAKYSRSSSFSLLIGGCCLFWGCCLFLNAFCRFRGVAFFGGVAYFGGAACFGPEISNGTAPDIICVPYSSFGRRTHFPAAFHFRCL